MPDAMQAQQIVPPESLPRLTPDEYLEMERGSETRHELVDGYLYAMTGTSDAATSARPTNLCRHSRNTC
jgi:hypothetical protein